MGRISVISIAVALGMLACTSEPGPTEVSAGPALAVAGTYTSRDLGSLGGTQTSANAINATGQVVGSSTLSNGDTHAFLWDKGVMKDLGTLGGNHSEALGINIRGHVVGFSSTATGAFHAFLWQDGHMKDLGTIGTRASSANDINDSDRIGGSAEGIAIIWKKGVLTPLKVPPKATFCDVSELNNASHLVGQCTIGSPATGSARAIRWDSDTIKDLGTLGGKISSPSGINRWGAVVGTSSLPANSALHAFLWQSGKFTDLTTHGAPAGFIPNAINDANQIVGLFVNGTHIVSAVWSKGKLTQFSLPNSDTRSTDINASGQVVGSAVLGNTSRGLIWTLQ